MDDFFIEMPGTLVSKQSSEVSKLFGPKSRGLAIAEYDPVTRQRRSSPSGYEGHYAYKGKSKILRRPQYTYAVTPKKTNKNKTYVGSRVKASRQMSRLMHDSWQDKKSFNAGDIRFKPAKMDQELIGKAFAPTPVGKAFLKPMAPMKPQAVLKPKPLKIAKPKAALKPKRPVS